MDERGDPGFIPRGRHAGSRRHREMKQSGAFEMAMKGRGDASLGRCEERGERWTVRAEKQGKHESKNGLGQEKGNMPINRGCCLTGPPPPSVPAAIDVHLGSTQPPSLQQHPLLLLRTLRATGGHIHSSVPLIMMATRAAQAQGLTFQGSLYYLGTSPLVCCASTRCSWLLRDWCVPYCALTTACSVRRSGEFTWRTNRHRWGMLNTPHTAEGWPRSWSPCSEHVCGRPTAAAS